MNDKAVPLLSGAPPQVRELDHDDSHAVDIDETSEESKPGSRTPDCPLGGRSRANSARRSLDLPFDGKHWRIVEFKIDYDPVGNGKAHSGLPVR